MDKMDKIENWTKLMIGQNWKLYKWTKWTKMDKNGQNGQNG